MKKDEHGRKRTAKSGKKKQSNLRQRQYTKKEEGEAGIGAVGAYKHGLTDFPSEISKQENKLLEQEEVKRNKESSNASFYLGANSKLGELFRRAKHDDVDAARMLLQCLTYNVGELEKFCSSKTRIAKRMVVIGESWPLLHTGLKANKDGALTIPPDHFLRKLGVVRGKRRFNTESVGTAEAIILYKQMEFYRYTARQTLWDKSEKHFKRIYDCIRRLKPLSPSNYGVWWKAAKPLFIWQRGKEFQGHPNFKKWNDDAYKDLAPHLARSAKRRDIKKAVEQGFMSLANSLRERVLD